MHKGRGPEQVNGLWEETLELESVTWRQGLCSAGLVLGLLMEIVSGVPGAQLSSFPHPGFAEHHQPSAFC